MIAPRMGGGFGHKFNGYAEEVLVCLLSKVTDAPVKWLESREFALMVGARHFDHRFEVGYDEDGVMLGLRNRMLADVGCLATWGGWGMAFMGGTTFPGPYRCVDYEIDVIPAITNKPPWNGFRGYGKEQAAIVLERIMDMIAADLDLDPAEVRRRNFVPKDAFPLWLQTKAHRLGRLLRRAREGARHGRLRGAPAGCARWPGAKAATSASGSVAS